VWLDIQEPMQMQRIMVIGCSGAGKSTISRIIGEKLSLPVHHLDVLFYLPGWVPVDPLVEETEQQKMVSNERWVIDGNYGRTMDIRWPRADTIIMMDFPRWRCLYRIIKRRIKYAGTSRPDLGPGCLEKIDWGFMRWVWNFKHHQRPKLLERLAKCTDKRVLILRTPREVNDFIASLAPINERVNA
jgi:adenylate kinase family enzyme